MARRLSLVILTVLLVNGGLLLGQQKPSETQAGRDLVLKADGRKLALIIGNDNYTRAPLLNARNDARAMSAALGELGFGVTTLENATHGQMVSAVARFGEGLRPADVAWFFFAGHGVQVGGENFLIPVDFTGTSETAVRLTTVPIAELQNAFSKAQVSIVVLDACRNNPFLGTRSGGRGLAPMEARGSLIAFATGAGQTASDNDTSGNGLFTQELLKVIREPNLSVRDMFFRVRQQVLQASGGQQFPAVYDGLVGNLTMSEAAAAPGDRPPVPDQRTAPIRVAQPPAVKSGSGATKWLLLGGGAAAAAGAAVVAGGSSGAEGGPTAQQSPAAANRPPSITSVSVTPTGPLLGSATIATLEVNATDPDANPMTAIWDVGPQTGTPLSGGRAIFRIQFGANGPETRTPAVNVSDGSATVSMVYPAITVRTVAGLWTGVLGQPNCSPPSGTCYTFRVSLAQNLSAVTGDYEDQFGRTGGVTGNTLDERGLRFSVTVGAHPIAGAGGTIDFSLTGNGSLTAFSGSGGASPVTITK